MSDDLSIFAAAGDAGDALALRIGDQRFTFAQLAALTHRRLRALEAGTRQDTAYPLVATNTLETVVTLYALLERRIPALLVHPRLTAPERVALLETAARTRDFSYSGAAVVVHTSGTTGQPRGAVLTRSALVASAQASTANLGWQADDCWLLCMPIARVGGLSIVTRCLAARRTVAVAPKFDAGLLPQWIAEHRATLLSVVPTMLTQLLDAHPAWTAPTHLRAILLGGAAASARLLERAQDRGLPIVITYGLTETCSQVAATRYDARFATSEHGAGMPLPGVQMRVVDGRIEFKGPMLMAGYWDAPALPPGGWFDTGDLGAIDARGCLHVEARRMDLIVTGGENVYPAEVERVLEACPGIAAAGVFGMPDETWGHTVAAALVAEQVPPADAALVEYIGAQLAPHKRPRQVCFIPRLPQTPAGKLDRLALPGLAQALRPLGRSRHVGA